MRFGIVPALLMPVKRIGGKYYLGDAPQRDTLINVGILE